jgi:protein-tyrosine phosphatase
MVKYFIKNSISSIYWSLYGKSIRNPKTPTQVKSILFICKGNICRSPFAEIFAKNISHIPDQYLFSSAGIYVESPQVPPLEAVMAGNDFRVDLQGHKSKSINYRMIESYDLIVAMEVWQFKYLNKLFPEFKEKTFLLPLFDKNSESLTNYSIYNIKDPYGKSQDDYNKCFDRIMCCIEGLIKDIHIHGKNIN